MVNIHPTAIVDPAAVLGEDVVIGPFCIVEAGVSVGDRTTLGPHVYIQGGTTLGTDNAVGYGAVLGGDAQHRSAAGEQTYLHIGDHNIIREGVTMHRASLAGEATRVGDHNMFMATCHLGHDVVVGSYTTLANLVTVGGHVHIEDRATIGGVTAIHQRVTVGELAMVGGMSAVNQDVPPYSTVAGITIRVLGINSVGLQRNGFDSALRSTLKKVMRVLFASGRNRSLALAELEESLPDPAPEVQRLLDFAKAMQNGRNGRQLEH